MVRHLDYGRPEPKQSDLYEIREAVDELIRQKRRIP